MSQAIWERKRDQFLDTVNNLYQKRISDLKEKQNDQPYRPVVGKDNIGNIPVDAAFLLVYAAVGNGRITRVQTLGRPPQISASGRQFMKDDSQREYARWQQALDTLVNWGWIKSTDRKGNIFELTGTGYKQADMLEKGMCIDTSIEPLEELTHFEGV